MTKRLQDKISIICGATSGIGEAMTKLFASEGSTVIFTGRRLELGKKIEEEILQSNGKVKFIQADSTIMQDLKAVVDYAIKEYGRIDVLCNNAGILYDATPTHEIDIETNYQNTFDINIKSQFMMNSLVIPHMLEAGKGSIINTSSIGADSPMPYFATYSASKAAIKQMTRSMAKEYASRGIRINCIQPGLTTSEMVPVEGSFEQNVLPAVAIGRPADPKEIAYGALFLASDESSYCCGTCLLIDGGLL